MGLIGLVIRLISFPFRLFSSPSSDNPEQLVAPPSTHGPKASGLPMDPSTPAGRSYLTLYAVGFVCAFDYVAHLMSSQLCWLVLGGPRHLYGLTVGIYDICLIVAAPAFGAVSDRFGYKWPLFVGVLCTTLGNALYGCLFLINHTTSALDGRISTTGWPYMIGARCIMGFGAAASASGTAYVTSRTTSAQRLASLGSYRRSQTYARMLGPLIGFAFIKLPAAIRNDDPVSTKLFNFFTLPAWVAVGLGSIVCLLVLFLFDDEAIPLVDTAHAQQPCVLSQSYPLPRIVALPLFTQLAFGTAFWSVYTQLTGFSIASFQVVQVQADLWKPYVGIAVGSIVGGFLWRKVVRLEAATATPTTGDISKVGCCAGMLVNVVGFLLLISYGGQSQKASEWQMYAAAVCFGIGSILYFSNDVVVYTRVLTWRAAEVKGSIAFMVALYTIAGAGGRALGPLIGSAIMAPVAHGDGQMNCDYRSDCDVPPSWNPNGPAGPDYCCISLVGYCTAGCEEANANVYLPVVTAFGVCIGLLTLYNHRAVALYEQHEGMQIHRSYPEGI